MKEFEENLILFVFVTGVFYGSWFCYGWLGVIGVLLFITFIIFAIRWIFQHSDDAEMKAYQDTPYFKDAVKFLEFYEVLPEKSYFIITPQYMGTIIASKDFARAVADHNRSDWGNDKRESFYNANKKFLGDDAGIAMIRSLSLDFEPHGIENNWSVIKKYASFHRQKPDGEMYKKAIQAYYKENYKKDLNIIYSPN